MPASDLTQPIAYDAEPTATLPARHLDGTQCRVGDRIPARTPRGDGEPSRAVTIALVVLVVVILAAIVAAANLTT